MSDLRSSVAADDWALVHDELLAGVVHACNNRVAALGALCELQEAGLSTPQEGFLALRTEVGKLRAMMELLRALMLKTGAKKEPSRFGDALQGASALLAHHIIARQWTFTVADEPSGTEPVLLWPSDPLRFAVLLLLAAGGHAPSGELRVAVMPSGTDVEISVVATGSAAEVEQRAEYLALQRAAELEAGSLRCRPYVDKTSVKVTLGLPGLTKARTKR